ncbi:MAG TPA: extracellular solute-binding protein [Bacillota bacterium]|jgi:multiple sugar transport system substrate-binding protein|nr:extracellular solute-binding protein [Fastidiosipila sp.]HPX92611.1 extracellular solute-binding protein [Bacillota bacterium]HQB81121.1 extracellular solute-binding protein [Bacillota bacterium]
MKRIRIVMSFILVMVMLFTFTACAKPGPAGGEITLNALFMKQAGYSEDEVTAMTDEFMAANSNIKINLTFVAYEELEPKILASAESGGYDVVLGDCIWPPAFAEAKLVLDVTDKVEKLDLDDIYEGALDSCKYEGKYYGLPWLNDVQYLFYNEAMLEQVGISKPPASWSEMFEFAQKIKDAGIVEYPVVSSWAQAECMITAFTVIAGVHGGAFVDASNNPTINSAENLTALEFWVESLNNGLINPTSIEMIEDDVLNTFCAGNAAFAVNWTYMNSVMNDPEQSAVAGQCKIAIIPGEGDIVSATVNGGMPLMITTGCKHPDEAWEYMLYLSSKDVQAKYCANALPIWKSLYTDSRVIETAGADLVEASGTQFQYIENRPMVPYYSELSTFMQAELQRALLGNVSAKDALDNMQQKALDLAAK